jgi:hypothetical protein
VGEVFQLKMYEILSGVEHENIENPTAGYVNAMKLVRRLLVIRQKEIHTDSWT